MTKMHIGQLHKCRWLGVNYHGIGGPGYRFLDVDFVQALEGIVGRLSGSYGKISVSEGISNSLLKQSMIQTSV